MKTETTVQIRVQVVSEEDIEHHNRMQKYRNIDRSTITKSPLLKGASKEFLDEIDNSNAMILGEIHIDIEGFSILDKKIKKQIIEELKKLV
jgi:hypothetical protein